MPKATPADFDLAREALLSITTADTVGEPAGSIDEVDGVTTVYFEATMRAYRGWRWTVSIAHVDGIEPSVLETELTPGEGALLSPEWTPWADRMADYRAAQVAGGADDDDDDDDDGDDDDERDDDERDDDDDDGFDDDDDDDEDFREHDDVDGVDIDSVDIDSVDIDSVEAVSVEVDDLATAASVRVDEPDDSEGDTDKARPEPKVRARRASTRNQKKSAEGE